MLEGLANHVGSFARWWLAELAGLIPGGSAGRAGRRSPRWVVVCDRARLVLVEERGKVATERATVETAARSDVSDTLSLLEGRTLDQPVGIRVSRDACLTRMLYIPVRALSDAAALGVLDLERATPLRAADVYTAVMPLPDLPAERGKIAIRQLVLKRETVRPIVEGLAAQGAEPAFIDVWNEDRTAGIPLDFLDAERSGTERAVRPVGYRLAQGLVVSAALGALAALAIVLVKQDNALTLLEHDVAAARIRAQAVGRRLSSAEAAMSDAGRVAELKSERLGTVEILEEVTRLLPDDTYLIEFALDGDQLDLSGFARSAPPLLAIFEASGAFSDARFTAPSRYEVREERERFSMRVKLRGRGGVPDTAGKPAGEKG